MALEELTQSYLVPQPSNIRPDISSIDYSGAQWTDNVVYADREASARMREEMRDENDKIAAEWRWAEEDKATPEPLTQVDVEIDEAAAEAEEEKLFADFRSRYGATQLKPRTPSVLELQLAAAREEQRAFRAGALSLLETLDRPLSPEAVAAEMKGRTFGAYDSNEDPLEWRAEVAADGQVPEWLAEYWYDAYNKGYFTGYEEGREDLSLPAPARLTLDALANRVSGGVANLRERFAAARSSQQPAY